MASRNLEYWEEYWESLFTGVEHDRFGFSLMSPRVVFKELAEEAARHLKNGDNKKFLFSKIKFYAESDPPSDMCLQPVLRLLLREFDAPRLEIVSQLCRSGLEILNTFSYYDHTVDHLKSLLSGSKVVSHEDLRNPCQNLIVELLECGYSEAFLKKVPSAIFDSVQIVNGFAHTNFPYETVAAQDWSDIQQVAEFNEQLEMEMNSKSEADRIEALKRYPRLPKKKRTFIFEVKGVRGTESFDLCGIKFYSPQKERILELAGDEGFNPEDFSEGEARYFNAAVPVDCIDSHSGAAHARRKLHSALNSLRFVLNGKSHYEIGNGYAVGDEKNKYCAGSRQADRRFGFYHWNRSIQITKDLRDGMLESELFRDFIPRIAAGAEVVGSMEARFQNSLHWFRKGSEAEAPEDKLLSFWISIENLLGAGLAGGRSNLLGRKGDESVVSLAFEVLPRIRCLSNVYHRGWLVHRATVNVFLNLPRARTSGDWSSLAERAGLGIGGDMIYLDHFIDCIPEIIDFLKDSVLCDNLRELYDFYKKDGMAIDVIEAEFEKFRADVVLLYRMRNKIVHNAQVNDALLPYYIRSSREFATGLITKGMEKCFRTGLSTPEGMIAAIYSDYDLLLMAINQRGAADVLFSK